MHATSACLPLLCLLALLQATTATHPHKSTPHRNMNHRRGAARHREAPVRRRLPQVSFLQKHPSVATLPLQELAYNGVLPVAPVSNAPLPAVPELPLLRIRVPGWLLPCGPLWAPVPSNPSASLVPLPPSL